MNKQLLLSVFMLLMTTVLVAHSSPHHCVNPRDYGAIPDDGIPDGAALQAVLEAAPPGAVICLESGTYEIDTTLEIKKPVTIRGVWNTTLAIHGGPHTLIAIPDLGFVRDVPTGITIERLTLDGRFVPGQTPTGANWFGIWVRQATHITLRDLITRNFRFEGITISNGDQQNRNVIVERLAVYNPGRQGLHVGSCEDCILRTILIDDPQTEWGPTAAVGIDIEVESIGVNRLSVDKSVADRGQLVAASGGLSVSPAYGPATSITVNSFSSVNGGISAAGAPSARLSDIHFLGTWVGNPNATVANAGIGMLSVTGATLTGSRIGIYGGGNTFGLGLSDVHDLTGTDNTLLRRKTLEPFSGAIYTDTTAPLSSEVTFTLRDSGPEQNRFYVLQAGMPNYFAAYPGFDINFSSIGTDVLALSPPTSKVTRHGNHLSILATDPQNFELRGVVLHNDYIDSWFTVPSGEVLRRVILQQQPVRGDRIEVRTYNPYGLRGVTKLTVQ